MTGTQPIRAGAGLAYGLLGLPLAFVALPLYVLLPNHYAREFGMPLATLGAVLLAARLFDAISDPLLGRLSDHLFGRSVRAVLGVGAVSAVVLALGFDQAFELFRVAHGDGARVVRHLLARGVVVAVDRNGFNPQALQRDQHLLAQLSRAQQHDFGGLRGQRGSKGRHGGAF